MSCILKTPQEIAQDCSLQKGLTYNGPFICLGCLTAVLDKANQEIERLNAALTLVAEPERQNKFSAQQIARRALRIEPIKP